MPLMLGREKPKAGWRLKSSLLLAAVLDFSNWSLQLLEEWECPRNLFLVLLNNKIEIVVSYRPAWQDIASRNSTH